MRWLVLTLPIAVLGCGGSVSVIPLLHEAGAPMTMTPTAAIPLEVVTHGTAVRDPLPVNGEDVAYQDLETALGYAISSAAVPWADAHRAQRPEGWQLLVDITQAEADYHHGRLLITLSVRGTLRTRFGQQYLAQTQASCRQGGLYAPEKGAPVLYHCMSSIGRELAGWLAGVEP
jgi:hypothetical protein